MSTRERRSNWLIVSFYGPTEINLFGNIFLKSDPWFTFISIILETYYFCFCLCVTRSSQIDDGPATVCRTKWLEIGPEKFGHFCTSPNTNRSLRWHVLSLSNFTSLLIYKDCKFSIRFLLFLLYLQHSRVFTWILIFICKLFFAIF